LVPDFKGPPIFNLADKTIGEYIGKHGNEVWNDWGCSGKPPVKFPFFTGFENDTRPGFGEDFSAGLE
jgi:hypothetical protein